MVTFKRMNSSFLSFNVYINTWKAIGASVWTSNKVPLQLNEIPELSKNTIYDMQLNLFVNDI